MQMHRPELRIVSAFQGMQSAISPNSKFSTWQFCLLFSLLQQYSKKYGPLIFPIYTSSAFF
jgi:hypothetical protein